MMMMIIIFAQVEQFAVGDIVKVAESLNTVKTLQRDHGEWTDMMKAVCSWTLYAYTGC